LLSFCLGKLNAEGIRVVLDGLVKDGFGIWQDEAKAVCVVSHRKFQDWANIMYDWAKGSFMMNKICTLYELSQGDATNGEEFHGVDTLILLKALHLLLEQDKVSLILSDSPDETGVKFLG
jgi:ESCRT-II complex subunit VPS25